jgi:hypothetical protein
MFLNKKRNECFQLKITLLEYKINKTYTMEGNASSLWKRVYGDVLATGRLTLQNQKRASLKITYELHFPSWSGTTLKRQIGNDLILPN